MIIWVTRMLVSGQKKKSHWCLEALSNRSIEFILAIFATAVTYMLRRIAAKTTIRLDWLTALWVAFELFCVGILYHQGFGYFFMSGGKDARSGFKEWASGGAETRRKTRLSQ